MSLRNVIRLVVFIHVYVNAEVLVTIPNGTIRGRIEYSSRNISFYAFQEIPFAKPPLGELRFREPQPAEGWEGVLDATKNTKICYQQTVDNVNLTLMQNEDCLYLNVYTPTYPPTNASLPVMFYIYGGGFVNGFAIFDTWGPHYFMEHEVIVVAANYRLGPFGFLTTGDLVIPGNYGLKDQLLALKWVNQNIKYFGGDPEKVTLFGQSAGAASVNFHYMSKKSQGLFRAGIAESGSIFSPWAYQEDYKKIAYDLASYVDSTFSRSSNSKELLQFLRNVPASDLAKAAASFPVQMLDDQIVQGFLFTPTIEPKHEDAFITETMYEAVEKGNINRAPMMMGICSEEAIYRAINMSSFKLLAEKLDNDVTLLVNKNMHLTDPTQIQAAGEAIHKFYTDGAFADNLGKAIRFFSDTSFNRGMIRYAELQSRFSFIFFYQFSYEGDLMEYRPSIDGAHRVSHGDDLRYLWAFGNWSVMDLQTPRDILMYERYLTLFTNFAKYTDPTPEISTLFDEIYWPVVIPYNFNYLDINDNFTTSDRTPKYDIYQNWVDLYRRMAVKPYTTF